MIENQKTSVSFILNGEKKCIFVNPLSRLSDVLRDDLLLTGTKVGCDAGDCGACTIQIDGEQHYACLTAMGQIEDREILTIEGLSRNDSLTTLQQSFLDEGAAQCGICTPAMLMAAQSLLNKNPQPNEKQVLDAIGGILCRCTGYTKIVQAIIKSGRGPTNTPSIESLNSVGSSMAKVDGIKKIIL